MNSVSTLPTTLSESQSSTHDVNITTESIGKHTAGPLCCCNAHQIETFVVIGITAILAAILWRCVVFAPIKLVAVFLHEISHALATWLTCGKVTGIEVNENFGGLTKSVGGKRCFILSAGYTGSVFWGSFFILLSWDYIPTRVAAVVFMLACIATVCILRIQEKEVCGCKCCYGMILRILILVMAAIPAGFWVLEEFVKMDVRPLSWCMLLFGTVCTLHALYDCLHDVLFKKMDDPNNKSDAVMFAEEICGSARCWGLIWSLISVCIILLVLFGIIVLTGKCYKH